MTDSSEVQELRRRIDLLEDENQRLRDKLEPIFGHESPCFDPGKFIRILQSRLTLLMLPIYSIALLLPLAIAGRRFIPPMRIAGLPAIDAAGFGTRHPGF